MLRRFRISSFVAALIVVACGASLRADEAAYYNVRIADLKLTDGTFEEPRDPAVQENWNNFSQLGNVVLDGEGEAYWVGVFGSTVRFRDTALDTWGTIVVRTPKAADVTGSLHFPNRTYTAYRTVKFVIPADRARVEWRRPFYEGKISHYDELLRQGIPGAAWFRHQRTTAVKELNSSNTTAPGEQRTFDSFRPYSEFDDTYSLFTGGRAISENLQLDRALPAARADETPVKLDSITGITIKGIDWKVKDLQVEFDPLASYIPADQHVVFFPTFDAMIGLSDEAERQGTPLLQLAEPQSQDVGVVTRYQRQIGLKTTTLGRLLGPKVIKSVALTGGDPYFRIGTDVALIFEPRDVDALRTMLIGQITLNTAGEKGVKRTEGMLRDMPYVSWRNPERTVSSYLATFGNAVVVTNSEAQLGRLLDVFLHASPSIASLDEYKFFRNRYKLGTADETAFVVVSDATIRRWCGPEWRIADSRRTRDLAVLSELQAANVRKLADGKIEPGPIYSDLKLSQSSEFRLTPAGVVSDTVGSIDFMTPISELRPLGYVTKSEAQAYERWRDGYQRNFSWAFDPIALRITASKDKLAGDLTVMPLIEATEYREFIAVSRGAVLKPTSGDPHGAAFHAALAINKDSTRLKELAGFARTFMPQLKVDPFSWIGDSVAVYADDSPIWGEFAKLKTHREREEFVEQRGFDFPVAVTIEVDSAFKAAAFLTGLHAFIDQTAPGMTLWESKEYRDAAYVKISPTAKAVRRGEPEEKLAVYYALNSDALTITLSEDLIRRVIDRHKAREERAIAAESPAENGDKEKDAEKLKELEAQRAAIEWLGESFCLEAGERALEIFASFSADQYQSEMKRLSWGNLPVLNEWHAMYPKQNPVELHERLWGVKLLCPGGGKYVWNEKFQTMESTVYGHPGEPKTGPAVPPQLTDFSRARFGLTFEPEGLRARAELSRKK